MAAKLWSGGSSVVRSASGALLWRGPRTLLGAIDHPIDLEIR